MYIPHIILEQIQLLRQKKLENSNDLVFKYKVLHSFGKKSIFK